MSNAAVDVDALPASLTDRARRIFSAIAELQSAMVVELGVPEGRLPADLSLRWSATMDVEEFVDQFARNAGEVVSAGDVYRAGAVYCYNCRSAGCTHATPEAPGEVFAGFGDTGRPRWQELFAFLTACEDDRVDQLFGRPSRVLARLVHRKQLIAAQLDSFGRSHLTYRIMAQVSAGYFTINGVRCALTAQIVETAQHALHAQLIAPPALLEALADAHEGERSSLHRIYDAIREFRRQIRELSPRWSACADRGERAGLRELLIGELRHLATSIERKGRQSTRRTSHAELRSRQRRPVHKAYDDLAAAGDGDFFRDNRTKSVVVVGKGSRLHVFSDEGRLVTSMTLQGDLLARRRQKRRYVPLPGSDRTAFLSVARPDTGETA